MPNEPFVDAAHTLIKGERFPPLILVGERQDKLVCLGLPHTDPAYQVNTID